MMKVILQFWASYLDQRNDILTQHTEMQLDGIYDAIDVAA